MDACSLKCLEQPTPQKVRKLTIAHPQLISWSLLDKFNNTVPGTLTDLTESNGSSTLIEMNTNINGLVSTMAESITKVSVFGIGGALFYTMIGVGGAIITLIFGFMIVCVLTGLSVQRKRKSHTLTVAATLLTHNDIHTQGMVYMLHKSYRYTHTHIYMVHITLLPFLRLCF